MTALRDIVQRLLLVPLTLLIRALLLLIHLENVLRLSHNDGAVDVVCDCCCDCSERE